MKIIYILPFILAFNSKAAVLFFSDTLKQKKEGHIVYDYNSPSATYLLPKELKEISGISNINDAEIACIEDEKGIIYIYDLEKNKVKTRIKFGPEGDYEGVAINNEIAYVLRSDGELYQISNLRSKNRTFASYNSGVPAQDNEGIVFDSIHGGLLIACKGKFGKGLVNQLRREIHIFNPEKKELNNKLLFSINIDSCISFAHLNQINLPTKTKNDSLVEIFKIRMSGMAIHPITRNLYILSAFDHAIFVFNENGEIMDITILDKELFPKAEGITFLTNGDMLISNEGNGTTQNIQHIKPVQN